MPEVVSKEILLLFQSRLLKRVGCVFRLHPLFDIFLIYLTYFDSSCALTSIYCDKSTIQCYSAMYTIKLELLSQSADSCSRLDDYQIPSLQRHLAITLPVLYVTAYTSTFVQFISRLLFPTATVQYFLYHVLLNYVPCLRFSLFFHFLWWWIKFLSLFYLFFVLDKLVTLEATLWLWKEESNLITICENHLNCAIVALSNWIYFRRLYRYT